MKGYVWQNERHRSGTRIRALHFSNLAVEGEIAVRVGSEIPAEAAGASALKLASYIEGWSPVIELHNYVFRGGKPTREELVAGNAMHAGFAVLPWNCGFGKSNGRSIAEWLEAEIRVQIDQTLVEESKVSSLPGGVLGSLRWLVSTLARCQQTLQRGQIVLTGSPGRLISAGAGHAVRVACGGRAVELLVA